MLVRFSIINSSTRSIIPNIPSLNDIAYYNLYGALSDNLDNKKVFRGKFDDNLDAAAVTLPSGTYNFILEAFDHNNILVLRGIRSNVVINVNTVNVQFSLSAVNDNNGTALVKIELPEENYIASVEMSIDAIILDPPLEIENNNIQFYDEMAAGDYFVKFYLKDSEGRILAVITEILVIRSGLESAKTITLTTDDFNIPLSPVNIQVTAVNYYSISFGWDVVKIANSYNIYRSDTENGLYLKLNTEPVFALHYTDNTVLSDSEYFYKLSSNNDDIEGLLSASIYAATLSTIPYNVKISSISDNSISLEWDAVLEASEYFIYRSETENGIFTKVNPEIINGTQFTDFGLIHNSKYYYEVSAVIFGIEGLRSNFLSAVTLLHAPDNLLINHMSDASATLTWNTVNGADGYIVEVHNNQPINEASLLVKTDVINNNNFTISDLIFNTEYHFIVKAVRSEQNHRIEGVSSEIVTALTLIPTPQFSNIQYYNTRINLFWNEVPSADFYRVYFNTVNSFDTAMQYEYDISGNNCSISNLNTGEVFYFWIRAFNFNNFSILSNEAEGKTITLTVDNIIVDFSIPVNPVIYGMPENIIQAPETNINISLLTSGEGWSNSYHWYLNGVSLGTGSTFTINWEVLQQLQIGQNEITIIATKNQIPYSASVKFKVINTVLY
ncbi:MAG: hypothetical protein FWD13_03465 [Treponema sp.]|nr:hypothetical protein [Treponema sp.]